MPTNTPRVPRPEWLGNLTGMKWNLSNAGPDLYAYILQLERDRERLRKAIEHEIYALRLVWDRQHGRVGEKDLNQGIALLDDALADTG